jgi:hypothetical protein
MKSISKSSKLLVGAVLAAVVSVSAYAARTYTHEIEYTYYDANGVMVGEGLRTCTGKKYVWGQETSNYDVITVPCEQF